MNKNYSWEVIKCLDFICDCSCNDDMWCEVKIPTALMPHWALLVITFQPTRTTIRGGGVLNSERCSALCLNVMLFVCRNFRQWRKYVLPYQKTQNCSHWAPCRILYSSLVNTGTDCFKATLVSTRGRAGTVLACFSTFFYHCFCHCSYYPVPERHTPSSWWQHYLQVWSGGCGQGKDANRSFSFVECNKLPVWF